MINDDDVAVVDRELSSELSNEDCLLGDEEVVLALSGLLPFIYHERRDDDDGRWMDDSDRDDSKIYLQ